MSQTETPARCSTFPPRIPQDLVHGLGRGDVIGRDFRPRLCRGAEHDQDGPGGLRRPRHRRRRAGPGHRRPHRALGNGRRLPGPASAPPGVDLQAVGKAGGRARRAAVPRHGRLPQGDRLAGPGSVVLLATPPAFRPMHLEYAVQKGMHVFMEKSFAVDAPGIRRVLRAGEEATKKNLKIAGGLMSRHAKCTEEVVQQIHDGAIGELITCWAYREHNPVGFTPKARRHERPGPSDPQLQQLHLAQRDLPVGLADPPDGRLLLGEERLARLRPRARRTPGPHRARPVVRPLRRGIHVSRRHADVLAGPAHGRLLGLRRQHPARLEGHRPHRRGRLQSPPLQGLQADARERHLGVQGTERRSLSGRARPCCSPRSARTSPTTRPSAAPRRR